MTTLVLIRHGQTDWNAQDRWQGQSDPPLNDTGREQARRAADFHSRYGFAALYSSDLQRAMETAQICGTETGVPVIPEPRLREMNLGHWQGMRAADIRAQYPDEFRNWHTAPHLVRPPGGETVPQLATRVLAAVNDILARHPKQRVGVVAHETPVAVVLCRAAGLSLEHLREMAPPNGAWSEVVLEDVLI